MKSSAVISDDGRYRYWLTREWDPSVQKVGWVMLNPSTADSSIDDATIRKCMGFARRWGCGGIVVTNLFALRSRNPRLLYTTPDAEREGQENGQYLTRLLRGIKVEATPAPLMAVIAAWGANGTRFPAYPQALRAMARSQGVQLSCLGKTKSGQPWHPLMLPYSAKLFPYHG